MAKKPIRDKRKKLECFVCEKPITKYDKIFNYPIDGLFYANIPIHRECHDSNKVDQFFKDYEKGREIIEKYAY